MVGYEDAGFFGRLFRRKVRVMPAQYRKRFGALCRTLETGVWCNSARRRRIYSCGGFHSAA
jgi:hypothetical protein